MPLPPSKAGELVTRRTLLRHTDIWCCRFFPARGGPLCCTDQHTRLGRSVSSLNRTGRIDKSFLRQRAIVLLVRPAAERAALNSRHNQFRRHAVVLALPCRSP